jgi:hypothetical protein
MPLGRRRETTGDKAHGYRTDEKQYRLTMRERLGIVDQVAPAVLADPRRECGDTISGAVGVGRERHIFAMQGLCRSMQRLRNAIHSIGRAEPLLMEQRSCRIAYIVDDLLGDSPMRGENVLIGTPWGYVLQDLIGMHIRSTSRVRTGSRGVGQGCDANPGVTE